jgi:hypothetical protein
VTVYTDGACLGNPGPGGYCAIVKAPGQAERVVSGGKARTTNNEMELTAALEGLKPALSQGASEITVVSDSEYLVKGMTSWVRGWIRNGRQGAQDELLFVIRASSGHRRDGRFQASPGRFGLGGLHETNDTLKGLGMAIGFGLGIGSEFEELADGGKIRPVAEGAERAVLDFRNLT